MSDYDCVGVVGGGTWGTTLANLLGKNGHKTLLWLRNEDIRAEINQKHLNTKYTRHFPISENVIATGSIQEVAERCELIVVAVPSQSFREISYALGNHIRGDQMLLSGSKGLETKTYSRMTTILREETCCKKVGVISGPNFAEEILKEHPTATVVASSFHEVIAKALQLFPSKYFRVYGNDDLVGAELGGAVKNVIAIAAGIIDGLEYGSNTKALLITRGVKEMSRIGVHLGANPFTFTGLTGLGDTMLTCSSKLSRNYRVGYYLAQGKTLDYIRNNLVTTAEGLHNAKVLHEFSLSAGINIPIMEGVYRIIYETIPIQEVISWLMLRKSDWEIDPTFI